MLGKEGRLFALGYALAAIYKGEEWLSTVPVGDTKAVTQGRSPSGDHVERRRAWWWGVASYCSKFLHFPESAFPSLWNKGQGLNGSLTDSGSSVTGLEMVDGLAGGPHAEEVPGVALRRDCLCRGDPLALFC